MQSLVQCVHGKATTNAADRAVSRRQARTAVSRAQIHSATTPSATATATVTEAMTEGPMFPDTANLDVLKEVVRLSEKYLDAQLSIIAALSQRAAAIAGMFGAGALAMVAVLVAVLNAQRPDATLLVFGIAMIPPIAMFAGCVCCALAASAGTFQPAGSDPISWKGNQAKEDLNEALVGQLDNYQGYITGNAAIITRHARHFRYGLMIGLTAPALLAAIGAAHFFFRDNPSPLAI